MRLTAPSTVRPLLGPPGRVVLPNRPCHPLGRRLVVRATDDKDDAEEEEVAELPKNKLTMTIKRKQRALEMQIEEIGMEALDERLGGGLTPIQPPYRLSRALEQSLPMGEPIIMLELKRPSPATTSSQLAETAKQYIAWGATAIVVPTDMEDTPEGLKDLFAVSQAVAGKVPVLARDWFLHPLQILEAKEAGASGVLGIVTSITATGTPIMSSFAAALGMDSPVEVINRTEIQAMEQSGVPQYAINCGVGLTVAIPGFANDIASGLLGELPFGATSVVGVKSLEEARSARMNGADCIFVKREMLTSSEDIPIMMEQLRYILSGDD